MWESILFSRPLDLTHTHTEKHNLYSFMHREQRKTQDVTPQRTETTEYSKSTSSDTCTHSQALHGLTKCSRNSCDAHTKCLPLTTHTNTDEKEIESKCAWPEAASISLFFCLLTQRLYISVYLTELSFISASVCHLCWALDTKTQLGF